VSLKPSLDVLSTEPFKYRAMVILDDFTGLRIGKLIGIDWDDIDLESSIITVIEVFIDI
jgi:integrase